MSQLLGELFRDRRNVCGAYRVDDQGDTERRFPAGGASIFSNVLIDRVLCATLVWDDRA